MTLTTAPLRTAADAVCAREGVDETGLSRPDLLALISEVEAVRKCADVLISQAAAEVERRSRLEDGHSGLAAREGFRSAKEMIARTTGGSMAEAGRLIEAGGLLAETEATSGDTHREDAGGDGDVGHSSAEHGSPDNGNKAADPDDADNPADPDNPHTDAPTPIQTLRGELA
ncbi:MAG: hypothetical protein WDZ57_00670, partial [Demequina sp.]